MNRPPNSGNSNSGKPPSGNTRPHSGRDRAPAYSEALEMSLEEFKTRRKSTDAVIVFFTGARCGPCRSMYGIYDDMKKHSPSNMDMFKIDVDASKDVSTYCDITSMPTFRFYFMGKLVHTFVGANEEMLIEQYNKLIDQLPE